MARPSKPEDQRAALVVGVRLTPAEKALVDQLTAPGPDGAPPRWTSASGLLRGLLHHEAQRRGLEPAELPGLFEGPPVESATAPPVPPPVTPAPVAPSAPTALPAALGGGMLPAGTLLLVWPPGWPLPVATPPPAVASTAPPVAAPVDPQPAPTPAAVSPPEPPASPTTSPTAPPAPTPPEARPLPPMPEPAAMLRRFERHLERSPGMLAKDAAAGAGLSPQDVSTFRQGRRVSEEKRARLWSWMVRGGE